MKTLKKETISDALVRLTCKDGRVLDTRTGIDYSEVICKANIVKFYKAV